MRAAIVTVDLDFCIGFVLFSTYHFNCCVFAEFLDICVEFIKFNSSVHDGNVCLILEFVAM